MWNSFWDQFETMPGLFWEHLGIMLTSCTQHLLSLVNPSRNIPVTFRTIMRSFWDHSGIMSGTLRSSYNHFPTISTAKGLKDYIKMTRKSLWQCSQTYYLKQSWAMNIKFHVFKLVGVHQQDDACLLPEKIGAHRRRTCKYDGYQHGCKPYLWF